MNKKFKQFLKSATLLTGGVLAQSAALAEAPPALPITQSGNQTNTDCVTRHCEPKAKQSRISSTEKTGLPHSLQSLAMTDNANDTNLSTHYVTVEKLSYEHALPTDAGLINVHDFGAKGDGIHDDTQAILKAITNSGGDPTQPFGWDSKIIYLPAGTYLISDTLLKKDDRGRFAAGMLLMGDGTDETTIKLKDSAPGFNNSSRPKAMIFTSSGQLDKATNKDYKRKGEGNDAYLNGIENLTIDVGAGNAGAIGIDYLANNMGAIRNVDLKASEGSGHTAIACTRKWPGPALIDDVTIDGFAAGIHIAQPEYSMTLKDVTLTNQRKVGLLNKDNLVAAHNLTISGTPLPIANPSKAGYVVVTGGDITQKEAQGRIFSNTGYMDLRDVKVDYASGKHKTFDGVYQGTKKLHSSTQDWSMDIKPTPKTFEEPANNWVKVKTTNGQDATAAIQSAFNSGAKTIYFQHGTYPISKNITVPGSVRRIIGMGATLTRANGAGSLKHKAGMLITENNSQPLTIEKLAFDHTDMGIQTAIEARGSAPIVLRDVLGLGTRTLHRTKNAGEAYIENTAGMMTIEGAAPAFAFQLNTEGQSSPRIEVDGAPMTIIGLKTELPQGSLRAANGAKVEVLGSYSYPVLENPADKVPFVAVDGKDTNSKLYVSGVVESYHDKGTPDSIVKNVDNNEGRVETTKWQLREQGHERGKGVVIPGLIAR